MKHLYLTLLIILIAFTGNAQFIEFDFDNATVSGNSVTQDIFIGSDGYRLTATHGSNSPATLFNNGTGDLFIQGTGGSRPEQNWTLTLIKNGSSENFDFISVDYFNNSGSNHTFIIGDTSNNPISAQTSIPPSDAGTLIVANQANATNLNSCLIFGLSFFSTMETYFNNLRIRPVSLLSNEDVKLSSVNYYQNAFKNLILSHERLEGATVEIMDMNGQLLNSIKVTSADDYEVDTSSYASGIYIARISIGNQVETIKFSK